MALEWLVENYNQPARVLFLLDSELVVRQLTGVYKVKNLGLAQIVFAIRQLEKKFLGAIHYQHVRREQNKEADCLVNLALDKRWPLE